MAVRSVRYDIECSTTEPLSPDPDVVGAMVEVDFGNTCEFGCKIYEDKDTGFRVLAHNSAYGCKK